MYTQIIDVYTYIYILWMCKKMFQEVFHAQIFKSHSIQEKTIVMSHGNSQKSCHSKVKNTQKLFHMESYFTQEF